MGVCRESPFKLKECNMLPFLLTILLFLFFFIIGYSILCHLHDADTGLHHMLLAPAIGLAVTNLLVFWLNWFGLPVIYFAKIVTGALLALALIGYYFASNKRIDRNTALEYLPFGGISYHRLRRWYE